MKEVVEKYKSVFHGYKILIVDDSESMRNIVKYMLAKIGFGSIFSACNGEEALASLKNSGFNLVIADLHMPKLNGFELLKQIRSDVLLKCLPVIIVSGEVDKDIVISVIQAGASDYVLKPISGEILQKKVIKHAVRSIVKPVKQ